MRPRDDAHDSTRRPNEPDATRYYVSPQTAVRRSGINHEQHQQEASQDVRHSEALSESLAPVDHTISESEGQSHVITQFCYIFL